MTDNIKWRLVIVILAVIVAVISIVPNFVNFKEKDWWFTKKKIVYGLDIQGGLHLVMGVDTEGVIIEKTARLSRSLKEDLKNKNIGVDSLSIENEDKTLLNVVVKTDQDVKSLSNYINEQYPDSIQVLKTSGRQVTLRYFENKIREQKQQIIRQAIEVIRNRIDEFGVSEPSITAQGSNRILVQLPGIQDAVRAKELINRTARLEFRIVSHDLEISKLSELIDQAEKSGNYGLGKEGLRYSAYVKKINEDLKGKIPENSLVVFQKPDTVATLEAGKVPYLVYRDTDLSGEQLEDASVHPGEYGQPEVVFSFNPEGRRRFSEITEKNVGKQMAIVLDEVVQGAPVIQGKIASSSARITLGGRDYQTTLNEANLMATALRAGSLPANLEQLEERTVGPNLGADSIVAGKRATMIGTALIFLFMILYYRKIGLVADIALALNIVFLLAILTSLGATLTLPGVAGIALTVGMAVDANIIIFERIKEELRKGASLPAAVKDGFSNAFSSIFDANVTAISTSLILMYYGTGPVRGFAVSLTIGIITSMFTAIFVSRVFIDILIKWFKVKNLVTV